MADNKMKELVFRLDSNEYVSSFIILFLIVYSAYLVNRVPIHILNYLDNVIVKLVIFFFIIYFLKQNPTIALMLTIAYLVSVQMLHKFTLDQNMLLLMSHEPMANIDQFNEIEHVEVDGESLSESALNELQNETKNEFYPQYANIKKVAHKGMFDGNSVNGFDSTAGYASI